MSLQTPPRLLAQSNKPISLPHYWQPDRFLKLTSGSTGTGTWTHHRHDIYRARRR